MMTTMTPRRPPVFNLPNQLTAARAGLAIVLFALIALHSWAWCLLVFALAAITDYLDGYLARRQGITSTLGRNLDPLVDKILICGAYIFLLPVADSGLAAWVVTVVVARELTITVLRSFLEGQGAKFGADWLGKIKMWLQCAALIAVFLLLLMREATGEVSAGTLLTRDGLIYAMVVITILSGLQYLWKAALLLRIED
jgi:CDP-diacylglycerol---glycerol-3-phosphate 3-phosphatidyltransferase